MHTFRSAASLALIVGALTVSAVAPALAGPGSSEPERLSSVGGLGYFWASSPNHGIELWRTDGTTAGTKIYQEFRAGSKGVSGGSAVASIGGRLYVYGNDGTHGLEPFTIDPATGTRKLLKDIVAGAGGSANDSAESVMFVGINGKVLFPADDGANGREWWVTNGTRAATKLLKAVNSDSSWLPQWYAKVGGKLLFSVAASGHYQTWATDGTTEGTAKISDVDGGDQSYRPALLLNGVAIMQGFTDATQSQLYGSDGSSLTLIMQINPSGYAEPNGFIKLGGVILFSADDGVHGSELWKTDGSPGGTTRISDINTSGSSTTEGDADDNQPVRIGTTVLFIANDGTGEELWKTDGTTVSRVRDINLTGGSNPRHLVASGGKVFFRADDGVNGEELWVSNGTKTGTKMLKDINTSGDGFGDGIVPLKNGRVLFTADDGVNGWEPWVSDGTKSGTKMLKDIR